MARTFWSVGVHLERGSYKSGRGCLEEEDLKSGPFTWTREHLGNKGNSIYWSYILFQAAYTTVFMYLEVSAEKRGVGTLHGFRQLPWLIRAAIHWGLPCAGFSDLILTATTWGGHYYTCFIDENKDGGLERLNNFPKVTMAKWLRQESNIGTSGSKA